jgi:hypothetical protein
MFDDDDYGYDEGSDIDNWEEEQVFQDHEGRDDIDEDDIEQEPNEDFGHFGEAGLWD